MPFVMILENISDTQSKWQLLGVLHRMHVGSHTVSPWHTNVESQNVSLLHLPEANLDSAHASGRLWTPHSQKLTFEIDCRKVKCLHVNTQS